MTGQALPLVIIEQDSCFVLTSLCGAESGVLKKGTANGTMPGLRGSGPALPRVAPDLTTGGILSLAVHAKSCVACRNAGAQLTQALRADRPQLLTLHAQAEGS